MKTIIDAVNELQGFWSDNKSMQYLMFGHTWKFSDYAVSDEAYFTKESFNKCVDEMSKAEWMSKPAIDWDNAPEGATHYHPDSRDYNEAWYKDIEPNCYKIALIKADGASGQWEFCNYSADVVSAGTLIPKAEPKPELPPVYTQAMCKSGVFPDVGMEVLVYIKEDNHQIDEWFPATCVGQYNEDCLCKVHDLDDGTEGFYDGFQIIHIRPITPPIQLVDGEAYSFDYHDMIGIKGVYKKPNLDGFDSFVGLFGSVSKPVCKNIKHLT